MQSRPLDRSDKEGFNQAISEQEKGKAERESFDWTRARTPQVSTPCFISWAPGPRRHVPSFPCGLVIVKFLIIFDSAKNPSFLTPTLPTPPVFPATMKAALRS